MSVEYLDIGTFELAEPSEVRAVQWTAEDQAADIVAWVEDNQSDSNQIAAYDADLSGASGPDGEDWGSLELMDAESTVEIAPYDWIVQGVTGKFYVIEDGRFTKIYRRTDHD